eukprot:TRINITY_DN2727_c0_g1_i2.p2 TRINITY_DN2727_c0_g1~~TRINITY_DN2727_c0_g1_i2.p2  ORF type:complete len:131 (-),score=4.60 TRINITY_DN2727_c0_g1_i2:221-613(-)
MNSKKTHSFFTIISAAERPEKLCTNVSLAGGCEILLQIYEIKIVQSPILFPVQQACADRQYSFLCVQPTHAQSQQNCHSEFHGTRDSEHDTEHQQMEHILFSERFKMKFIITQYTHGTALLTQKAKPILH